MMKKIFVFGFLILIGMTISACGNSNTIEVGEDSSLGSSQDPSQSQPEATEAVIEEEGGGVEETQEEPDNETLPGMLLSGIWSDLGETFEDDEGQIGLVLFPDGGFYFFNGYFQGTYSPLDRNTVQFELNPPTPDSAPSFQASVDLSDSKEEMVLTLQDSSLDQLNSSPIILKKISPDSSNSIESDIEGKWLYLPWFMVESENPLKFAGVAPYSTGRPYIFKNNGELEFENNFAEEDSLQYEAVGDTLIITDKSGNKQALEPHNLGNVLLIPGIDGDGAFSENSSIILFKQDD